MRGASSPLFLFTFLLLLSFLSLDKSPAALEATLYSAQANPVFRGSLLPFNIILEDVSEPCYCLFSTTLASGNQIISPTQSLVNSTSFNPTGNGTFFQTFDVLILGESFVASLECFSDESYTTPIQDGKDTLKVQVISGVKLGVNLAHMPEKPIVQKETITVNVSISNQVSEHKNPPPLAFSA